MNPYTGSLLLFAVVITQTYGAIYDQAFQLPVYDYDYIVIGGTLPTPYYDWKGGAQL